MAEVARPRAAAAETRAETAQGLWRVDRTRRAEQAATAACLQPAERLELETAQRELAPADAPPQEQPPEPKPCRDRQSPARQGAVPAVAEVLPQPGAVADRQQAPSAVRSRHRPEETASQAGPKAQTVEAGGPLPPEAAVQGWLVRGRQAVGALPLQLVGLPAARAVVRVRDQVQAWPPLSPSRAGQILPAPRSRAQARAAPDQGLAARVPGAALP